MEDGLLHREVLSVFEDKDGFIWIGSIKGIQRFDGHEFKSWTKADHEGRIAHITSIGQDPSGWLWLWNNQIEEFIFLDPKSEIILSPEERFGKEFSVKGKIGDKWRYSGVDRYLKSDSKGRFYFVCSNPNELIVFDVEKGLKSFPLPDLKADYLELYFIDSRDHLWVTESFTNSTLYRIDTLGSVLNSYDYTYSYDVTEFKEVDGVVYYLVITNQKNTYYKIDSTGNDKVISEDLWFAKNEGFFSWNATNKSAKYLEAFKNDNRAPILKIDKKNLPLPFKDLRFSVFEGSQDRFWFPSAWGLGLATVKPNRFKNYFTFGDKEAKPIINSARGILVEEDTLFANFEFGGLVSIPKKEPNQWMILNQEEFNDYYYGRPLVRSEEGGLYVGHDKGEIRHIDKGLEQNRSITFLEGLSINSKTSLWTFYKDANKKLWIGTDYGLIYKNADDSHLHYIQVNEPFKEIGIIFHILPHDNKLWLSGDKGLYLFDLQTRTYLSKYGIDEPEPFQLPCSQFNFLHIDKEEIFWLGTNEGLLRWNRTTKEKKLFTTVDGLSNDVIYSIYEDDYNKLWLSSDYGIMQFDKETFYINAYLEKDGITHQEFNRTSAFKEENGTIYFGGLNGITSFHPKDFHQLDRSESSKMLISGYEIFDGNSSKLLDKVGELRTTNVIDFYPDDRFFRLKFALPIFENIKKINYAWQVEGVDKEWNYQKENTIQIGKLPYGSYTLRVKGQSDDGEWSPHELAIQVNVLKPFYLQMWFIVLSILSLLLAAFAFFNWRTRQLKIRQDILEKEIQKATTKIGKQTEELKQLDKVKSRFFANVSHELRTPLTLMLGPISSILKNNNLNNKDFTHLKKAQQNGKELLKLVASILNLSKLESGKLELQEKPEILFPLIRRLCSAFESHAERGGIRFSFVYQTEKDLQLELDKGKLEVIINNLLSNALKFSQSGGQVIISVEDLGEVIQVSVEDKGRGIHETDLPHVFDRFYQSDEGDAPTEGGTGIGLALSQELIQVMNGKIWVESEWGKGSTFFIEFPRKEILGIAPIQEVQQIEAVDQVEATPIMIPQKENLKEEAVQQSTILIVEDNHSLRDYLKTILEPYYTIWTAENGLVALDLLKENQESLPSLVLSDVMMPVMDGFQLLEVLKSREYFRHLPVIMLTARADIQDKIKALRIGVDDYLLKPFEEDELLARVENILNNYQERIISQSLYSEEKEETKLIPPQKKETPKKVIPVFSVEDANWLEELETHLKEHLSNNKYSISQLAFDIAISERQLRRRIKTLTGLSPTQYLKETRLQEARQLLEQRKFNTIAQTAGAVGFQDPGAFSRNFSNRFGKMPSEYLLD